MRNRLSGSTDHLVFSDLVMATSVSAVKGPAGLRSSFSGGWGNSLMGEDQLMLARSVPARVRVSTRPVRPQPMMKNVNEGKGLFAPIVVVTRNIIGKKRFNQLRGKAIALHSQVPIFISCFAKLAFSLWHADLRSRVYKILGYHAPRSN